jgi:hypothetical protein
MGSTGGAEAMMRKLGLTGSQVAARDGSIDAIVVMDDVEDVW